MMVRRARSLGYALNRNDITDGVTGVGIVLGGRPDLPDLALSVAAISSRLDEDRQKEVVEVIRTEAALIMKRLARSGSA